MKRIYFLFLVLVTVVYACSDATITDTQKETLNLPEQPYAYDVLNLPAGSSPVIMDDFEIINGQTFFNNKLDITPWGATLGRVLFYDKKLSLNNTIACGSCHHQDKAFADGKQFSTGFEGRVTTRNSMAIVNPILQNNLFWDSRSKSLHDLSLKPVVNHIEMGMEDLDLLVAKLEATDYYKPLFQKAYGTQEITSEKIAKSISQFVGSITTSRSRFDIAQSNNMSNFSELEKLGMEIFNSKQGQCASCHGGGNMAAQDGPNDPYGGGGGSFGAPVEDMQGATNIGLELDYSDEGVKDGRFRIPSLRNIALTAPYMHDGRFQTLEQVLNHYTDGIQPHKNLDVKFTDGHGNLKRLNLNSIEKAAIIAFLKTLTDNEMIKDPKYSNPFKS